MTTVRAPAKLTLALRVVNQNARAVALARVQAVCRQSADPPGHPEANGASTARAQPAPDRATEGGVASWVDDVSSLYGGEAFL